MLQTNPYHTHPWKKLERMVKRKQKIPKTKNKPRKQGFNVGESGRRQQKPGWFHNKHITRNHKMRNHKKSMHTRQRGDVSTGSLELYCWGQESFQNELLAKGVKKKGFFFIP